MKFPYQDTVTTTLDGTFMCFLQMLEALYSLRVLVWSSVVDVIAPQAHKQQHQQQQAPSQSSSWLQAWRGGSSGADGHQQQQQAQEAAAAAAAGSSGSSGTPGAVDPAMLLKGVNVLLLDLQADLPLMYRSAGCVWVDGWAGGVRA
jgi:hypothetical protein